MAFETVEFRVAGRLLAHTGCKLSVSAEAVARSASFSVAWTGPGIPCRPDEEATVVVSGELWGTGYVRDVNGSHGRDSRDYEVSFVSRAVDAVECSIEHPTWLKEDADLGAVAQEFDTLGIGIEVAAQTARKAVHKVSPGESLFETLKPDALAQGVLVHDTPAGRLRLADGPEGRQTGALRRGVNIVEASGNLSGANAVSGVTVRGQSSDGTTGTALRLEARAAGAARRRRPRVLVLEGEASTVHVGKRAEWEARRAAGEGARATITVAGWRDAGGRLWTRNHLIEVSDDWLGIEQDMVIATVTLAQDGRAGTTATLEVKDPRALGGRSAHGKSDAAYDAPEPEAKVTVAEPVVGVDY